MEDDLKPTPYEPQSARSEYPEHQLVPLKGGRYQRVFHGPPGTDVGDLHCDLEPVGEVVDGEQKTWVVNHSGWEPSDEQIAQLSAGGHIRLSVYMHPIPPLAMSIEPPVDADGSPMIWNQRLGAYVTAGLARNIEQRQGEMDAEDDRDTARRAEEEVRRDFRPE